ncbi:hypothetical protein MLD38_037674 [Melastoma candidum]|uniref:Uncharacterized protein n=1 Tax=Melastoma candidum TaxID=119954 RepID=A0ACB9LNZ6_9MYRT|nr:hypothetical protein MLD38_037674 [Melastoma candidum]
MPSGFGNLTNLEVLTLTSNRLSGEIPSSLGNLIHLVSLDLRYNQLGGRIHSSLGNLSRFEWLYLHSNQLVGGIPLSLMKLPLLSILDVGSNMLTGIVPSQISNLTRLTELDISANRFHGPVPDSIYRLWNLSVIRLGSNDLTGVARLDLLLQLDGVMEVDLSSNAFSSIIFPKPNANVSQIKVLDLGSSNLTEVPRFLKRQHMLDELSLSNNKISGQIPEWLLQGIIGTLDLSFNYFQGTLPVPPNSIGYYRLSSNRLSGEIPASTCELDIDVLDLADNNFYGPLPLCFGNFSSSLRALSLSGNNFTGEIPDFSHEPCRLLMMDLSSNVFEGQLPRSLTNCRRLQYVNFGRNKITDSFPSWLGLLPWLKVLMLHSNRFHGVMTAPSNNSLFPSLKVITLSENNLGGRLPADYFASLPAMKYFSPDDEFVDPFAQMITLTILDKGIEREFGKTLGYFTLVDLSNNNFSGTIPVSIGDYLLKLHTLNLSNNSLSGPIPQSLANLRKLEVLDLSRNRLSGEIPRVLTRMTSLNHFNVSYNNLSGSIPNGNQFGTFENTSYIGNPELCGSPLTKKCGNSPLIPTSPADNQPGKSSRPLGIVWITGLVGLVGGLVVGVALEHAFGADVLNWLAWKWHNYWPR